MTVKPEFADFLERAKASGGAEMANCQPFIERLCGHLDLPQPDLAGPANEINDYVYERRVDHHHPSGKVSARRMDLYKRDCFILEAKQSVARRQAADQLSLHLPDGTTKAGQAPRGGPRWDAMMGAAKAQAEGYARDLPVDHDYPPFLLILDVGNELQVFADFSGQGRNYTQFPDRKTYRISMDDLLLTDVQARLRAIWMDPASLNPARRAAQVTQDVAERLAIVARRLERRHPAEEVAAFLMRCLFTMFAEDVELIPRRSFETLLERLRGNPAGFVPEVAALWQAMDEGTYAVPISTAVRRFNGSLFKDRTVLELDAEEITELHIAATKDWRDVEPAIFGTLLERALSTRERAKLGAHYTPRIYVERLVVPTIMEPLREDWAVTRAAALEAHGKGDDRGAATLLRGFARQLADTHVLDPACGTGNFLYVALEMMKRLEGEVLDTVEHFGIGEGLAMRGASVTPAQFHGIEINPRAAIADLVLWIGYLKLQLRTVDAAQLGDPVLERFGTIEHRDALLVHDGTDPVTDDAGEPVMVWDRIGTRPHPTLAGAVVPDRQAVTPMVRYRKPRQAPWPEVEFIVGNPPFIGGKDLRAELGDGYAEAIWAANREVQGGADFVMQWWDRAAERLRRKGKKDAPNRLRRFGFITTNSITQTFSRRVVERHLKAKDPVHLVYAVADHPWMKMAGRAAVRIALTVVEAGAGEGALGRVVAEEKLNTDAPEVELETVRGTITAKLTLGADVTAAVGLWANKQLAYKGYMPWGSGFWIPSNSAVAKELRNNAPERLLQYYNGSDLTRRPRGILAIDLYGMSLKDVMAVLPNTYSHLRKTVFPERNAVKRQAYRDNWWIFAEARPGMRDALGDQAQFIATAETAKHRMFRMLSVDQAPDQKVRIVAVQGFDLLSVLSSKTHVLWAEALGGRQGVGNDPVYNSRLIFDPFPFPLPDAATRAALADLGTRLDAHRAERLAAHDHLTMTGLYNALERLREREADLGPDLTEAERDTMDAGRIRILADLHDAIDRVVLDAYGWGDLAGALVGRVGATLPSPHKSPAQDAAEDDLLARLVDLNRARTTKEARGVIHWLRPAFQRARLAGKYPRASQGELATEAVSIPVARLTWPKDPLAQFRALRRVVRAAPDAVAPDAVARAFKGGRSATVADRLRTMREIGMIEPGSEVGTFYAPA